ncbi:MAG: hypothetical protein ACJ74X_11360 [Gaiellaceae bacterium]
MGGLLVPVVLAASLCGPGKPVMAVSYRVVNDVDTGVKSNNWAFDTYTRDVRVWRAGRGKFCSVSKYDGEFASIEGASPGGKWRLPAGIRGTFTGTSVTTFRGKLALRGAPPRGYLGVKDFACSSADAKGRCSGTWDWLRAYFTNVSAFRYTRYGFRYHAKENGTGTWTDKLLAGKIRTSGDIKPAKS